jgi:DNA-binding MarR family transcriptional regulator
MAMAEFPVGTIYLLKRAELAVRGCVEVALREVELTPSQYFILLLVKLGDATSSAELARSMGILPQSMTELIAPLEGMRAITRGPDPNNNRILRIALTAAGERLFAKATDIAIRLERELLEGFDQRDLAHLNQAFTELTAKAEAHACHPKLQRLTKVASKLKRPGTTKKATLRPRRAASRR